MLHCHHQPAPVLSKRGASRSAAAAVVTPRAAADVRAPTAPNKRFLTLPSVTYSNAKEDINLVQLQQLYSKVSQHSSLHCGSQTQRSFFQHWQQLSDEEAQHKLQLLLHKSVAVAAAFVRDNNLYTMDEESSSDDDDDEYRDTASTSGRSSSSSSSSKSSGFPGTWGPFAWRQRLPRRLVGFVRASGDNALVATVHDLIIHPDLQGFGLGSRLLRRLTQQIADDGVYDVGTVTPSSLMPFFRSSSFELDREDSVPMALRRSAWLEEDVEVVQQFGVANNPRLAQLLKQASL